MVASVESRTEVELARGTRLTADTVITSLPRSEFDVVICPGGMPGAVSDGVVLTCDDIQHVKLAGMFAW